MYSIKNHKMRGFAVWLICALFFLYEFLLRTAVGTFQTPLTQEWQLSSFEFSLLSTSLYALMYGIMQVPAGIIIDKHGLKKSLLFGAIICSIATIGFAEANSYLSASLFRMLTGLGASFGFICLLVAIYDWLHQANRGFWIGFSQLIGTLGPILAAGPITSYARHHTISWRTIFVYLGILGFIITVLVLKFVRNNQENTNTQFDQISKTPSGASHFFRHAQPWFIALFSACTYVSIEYFSENEGLTFMTLKGYDIEFASWLVSLSWIGFAVGCPLLGFISDCLKRRKIIAMIAAILHLSALFMIIYANHQIIQCIGWLLLGIGASGQSIGFALMAEQTSHSRIAVGLGINNTVITAVITCTAPFIARLIDTLKVSNDTLTIQHYQAAFLTLISLASIGLIMACYCIEETFCQQMNQRH